MQKLGRLVLPILLALGICWAQSTAPQPAPTNLPGAPFPRINADRSVTFRIRAERAQVVQVNLGPSAYDMTRTADGFWEATTKPLAPGFYYYGMAVDGFASNDPGSRVFFASRQEVSGLEVPGPESDFFAVKDVPHGTVRTLWYVSKATGETRRIFVYTPPGYDQGPARYPVLYCSTATEKTKQDGPSRPRELHSGQSDRRP